MGITWQIADAHGERRREYQAKHSRSIPGNHRLGSRDRFGERFERVRFGRTREARTRCLTRHRGRAEVDSTDVPAAHQAAGVCPPRVSRRILGARCRLAPALGRQDAEESRQSYGACSRLAWSVLLAVRRFGRSNLRTTRRLRRRSHPTGLAMTSLLPSRLDMTSLRSRMHAETVESTRTAPLSVLRALSATAL